ncbi:hypothetical protein SETIT_4G034400v2 [Setaria italica]|uniref:Myb/SANT-like domain-containing protein n=1 Tax=Setaria italica TaxID=4555 RepID=A0A368QQB4_SETIT|nr:hypothetical protein SETIT_4G034400v2 [Setaria italica]
MNDSGWKVDTGHKSGYLSLIEKELAKRLPNAHIKADPHIQSKVKTLKKLLGFDWDDERKMVVGDKDQFMGWAKAKGPGDQFDLHEELSSTDVIEQTQQMDSAVDSHSQPPCHGSNSSSGVKSLAGPLNTLVEAETANAAAMNAMQSAFTQELEAQKRTDERRKQLFSVLKKLSGFSRDQVVQAALVIGQNEKRLNLFFTTPDELKSEFVHQVLKRPKKM